MKSRVAVLATLALISLPLTVAAGAQATNPPYLREMPSMERVTAEIKGADAMDTAARRMGAFWQLMQIIQELAGQRLYRNQLTPDEGRLLGQYRLGYSTAEQPYAHIPRSPSHPDKEKWFKAHTFYENDPGFRDELLDKFFTEEFRAAYYRATGKPRQGNRPAGNAPTAAAAKPPSTGGPTGRPASKSAGGRATTYEEGMDYDARLKSAQAGVALGKAFLKAKKDAAAKGAFAQAIETYKELIAKYPGYTQPYIQLAELYQNQGEYGLAITYWKQELSIKPDDWYAFHYLGLCYEALGDYPSALAAAEQAARFKPGDAVLEHHLGRLYVKTGRKQEALQVYRRLLTLDKQGAQELYEAINKAPNSQPAAGSGNAASPPVGGAGRPPSQRANVRPAAPTDTRPNRPANTAPAAAAAKPSDRQTRPTPSRCPVVRVTCLGSFEEGMPASFGAEVSGGDPKVTPTFNWAVSAGTIAAGQGTSAVMVDTMGVGMQSVTATVVVGGYARDCGASASCTMSVFKPKPRKFDEYGGPPAERTENLINFEIQLLREPGAQAYIITYGGRTSRPGEAKAAADKAKDYLVNTRGSEAARIVTVDGGYREQPSVELWIVPEGASPPAPTPTVDAKDVKPPRKPAAKPRTPPKGKKT